MLSVDGQLLQQYRQRWDELEEALAEVRECPFCGNVTRIPARHDDDCPFRPVEACNRAYPDDIGGDAYMICELKIGHAGECR